MKLFGRKTLALLLALTMTVVLMSVSAFAEDFAITGGNKVAVGATIALNAENVPAGATVEWSSSDEAATVNAAGVVQGVKKGNATIIATAKNGDSTVGNPATHTVQVYVPVSGVTISSSDSTVKVGNKLTLTATVSPDDAETKTFTWSSSDKAVATVSDDGVVTPVKHGKTTITVTTTDGNKTASREITVLPASVTGATLADKDKAIQIPNGSSDADVRKLLPTTFNATVDGTAETNLSIAEFYNDWSIPSDIATKPYNSEVNVTATAKTGITADTLTVKVTLGEKSVTNVEPQTVYFWEGRSSELSSSHINDVALLSPIRNALGENSKNNITFDISFPSKPTYGSVSTSGVWSIDEWPSSASSNTLTVEVPFTAIGTGTANKDLRYSGKVKISVERLINHITAKMENSTSTESFFRTRVADAIENIAKKLSGSKYYVVFDTIGSDGGTLYLASDKDDVADEGEVYNSTALQKMVYESNYDGEDFKLEYSVYDNADARTSGWIFSGSIVIKNPQILNLKVSITKDDVYNFSSQELQDALSALDSDWTLTKIYLNNISTNGGKLCYDYDDSKALSKNEQAKQGEYYVEPSNRQKSIDLITYVPKEKSSSRSYTAEFGFKATYTYTTRQGNKRTGTVDGMLVITVQEPADITISAPANGYATLDASLFTDYCADHVRSTHKNYDICYVEFTGAPNSTAYGYLYENYKSGIYNGAKIKSPNGKKFALTDISAKDKNAYDLESVSYVPGTRNCTGGTFAIYGVKPGETIKSSTKFVKLCDGTIDFVIDGGSVSGNTKKVDLLASQTYSNFYYDLINGNVASVQFVSVTGGKLIYRDVSSQTPITPGPDVYYLSSTGYLAGRRMLSNVVFLPGYNQTSATITLKAFDAKGKSANAQYIFTIKPVTTSSFSDMNGYSSYAGSVGLMTNLGIINGVGNNKFNPTGTVTRGEWITMLYRAAGSPAVYSSANFTDVPSWCKNAVQWAVQNGITDGIGNNKFGPDMTLDRMQIVTFMYRFAKLQGMDVSSTLYLSAYTDGNTVDTWAQPAMKWALQKGYLDPVGGKIQPKGTMTRVMVADCLARLLTK